MPIAAIAPHLQHAFVAVEDHRFFLHPGVDPIALARAVVRNVREPARVQGGSTLTQQLARTLFLSNRKSYGRKAREAVLAFLIEAQLSKQQILELYLNRIFLGAGIYGVEAMSQRVFGKPAKDADAGRERADRRPGARAGGAVAVVESRRGPRAQPRRAGAHARREIHHRAAVSRRAAGAVARPPLSQRQRCAPRLREGLPAAAVPRRIRRRSSARLARADDLRRRAAGRRRSARSRTGCSSTGQAVAAGGAGGDRSGDRQHPGAGRRPRLPALGVQSRQPQPASARIGVQAVRVCRGARARHVAGLDR